MPRTIWWLKKGQDTWSWCFFASNEMMNNSEGSIPVNFLKNSLIKHNQILLNVAYIWTGARLGKIFEHVMYDWSHLIRWVPSLVSFFFFSFSQGLHQNKNSSLWLWLPLIIPCRWIFSDLIGSSIWDWILYQYAIKRVCICHVNDMNCCFSCVDEIIVQIDICCAYLSCISNTQLHIQVWRRHCTNALLITWFTCFLVRHFLFSMENDINWSQVGI